MKKTLLPLAVMLLATAGLYGQTPTNIIIEGGASAGLRAPCTENDAGTIQGFGPFSGQSNDVDPDTIYLCLGDTLPLTHNMDFSLAGDPVPATPAGIAYAFYDDVPTVDGPNIDAVRADPALNTTSPLIINNTAFAQTNGIWLAPTPGGNGNLDLINNGGLQEAYNGGNPAPIQFWFAPITVDNAPIQAYENDGPCVSVSIDEAFSVVYLEAIQLTEEFVNPGPGLDGAFVLEGGLPEFDGTTNYNITINPLDPSGTAGTVVTANPGHEDTIRYTVDRPGRYELIVEDGKSCGLIDTIEVPVVFNVGTVNGAPGDIVCVPVTVENFTNITNAQFSMQWNPFELSFESIDNLTTALPSFDNGSFNTGLTNNGQLTVAWADLLFTPHNLPDGSVLFEVCFEVIGNLGDFAEVDITDAPTSIGVGNANLDFPFSNFPFLLSGGGVNITNQILLAEAFGNNVTCGGGSNGSFDLTIAGGVAPYTYAWNSVPPTGPNDTGTVGVSGDTITEGGLMSGIYSITVTDSDLPANMDTIEVQILDGLNLGADFSTVQPSCNGSQDGSITVTPVIDGVVVNPTPPGYIFVWNTGQATQTIDSVGFNGGMPYNVTITSPQGCSTTASVTLSQPSALSLPLQNDPGVIDDAACTGATDGSITVMAMGGSPDNGNYTYEWATLGTVTAPSDAQTDLEPGQYSLTVTDANGCTIQRTYTVGAEKTLGVTLVNLQDVSCNGGNDGAITVDGTSFGAPAVAPLSFSWTNIGTGATFTGPAITGLEPGDYEVVFADSDPAGCSARDTFTVGEPAPLDIQLANLQNESCDNGGNDGSITISVTGGTFPYSYEWSDMQTDSIATGLSEGNYIVEVTDANNCTQTADFDITAPTPPTVTVLNNDTLDCAEDTNGVLNVTAVQGGAPIASYEWSTGGTGTGISGLSPGIYIVTITAEDGCFTVDSAAVVAPAPLVIDSIVATSPSCVGESNGNLVVNVSGGTAPYTYEWDDQTLSNPLYPGLAAGTYNVTVTDANGCTPATGTQEVSDPAGIVVEFTDIQGATCFTSVCDGAATATASYEDGSTGLFNFIWEAGTIDLDVMSSTGTDLCRDTQIVNVTDENGCTQAAEVFIPSPEPLSLIVDANDVSCAGEGDGSITVTATGGVGNFVYLWPDLGETGNSVEGLEAGEYTVEVEDGNGCPLEAQIPIDEPDPLILSVDQGSTRDVSCFGEEDGQIAVSYNFNDNINGVSDNPFSFSANVPPANASTSLGFADGLPAGTYVVTITDSLGCQDSVSITLTEPTEIMAVIPDPEDPPCFDASTLLFIDTIFGGAGTTLSDYRYMVDGNGLLLTPGVPADLFGDGLHFVEIFDPNGCSTFDTVSIDQPEEIIVDFNPNDIEVELGDSTTRLEPVITPLGTVIDSFIWTPSDYLSSPSVERPIVAPLESLEYTLTVVDENGCRASGSIFVELDANRNIYIPNAFSPNGDGVNDEFRIYPCTGVTNIATARIFDRWGNLVYENAGLDVSNGLFCQGGLPLWEGRFNSEPLNKGVYVYVIEVVFLDGVRLVYRGDVSLVR